MMVKEPELKLFGRNILLPEKGRTAAGEYSCESSVESSNGGAVDCGVCWYVSGGKNREGGVKADGDEKQGMADGEKEEEEEEEEEEICEASYQDLNQNPEESHNTPNYPPSEPGEIPKTPLPGHRPPPKALKKPAKILPCPRCKSTDTKFCYFNNYNLNQPRHFCKACQRYWTHGGTMRNVPVGSGRRKIKAYYRVPVTPTNPNGENGPGGPVSMYYYYIASVGHTGFPRSGPNAPIGVGPGKRSRVDDPRQAVKSSIWSTLGIECADFRKEGLLKGLQLRGRREKVERCR